MERHPQQPDKFFFVNVVIEEFSVDSLMKVYELMGYLSRSHTMIMDDYRGSLPVMPVYRV